jgi:hypothetical protein
MRRAVLLFWVFWISALWVMGWGYEFWVMVLGYGFWVTDAQGIP